MDLDEQLCDMATRIRKHGNTEAADALEACAAYLEETPRNPGDLVEALVTMRDNAQAAMQLVLKHQDRL